MHPLLPSLALIFRAPLLRTLGPRYIRVCLLGLSLLVAGSLGGCGNADPISVSPSTHDFGRVLKGDQPDTVFTLTNNSDRVVGFKAQANCACFAVAQGLTPLDPGQSLQFRVLFDTTALPPQVVQGKYVTIHTDHPDAPALVVPLEGEIYRAYTLTPADFNLGRIDGRPRNYESRYVNIRPLEGHTLRVEDIFQTPEVFKIEAKDVGAGGIDVSITLEEAARRPISPFQGKVRLSLEATASDGSVRTRQHVVRLNGFWSLK